MKCSLRRRAWSVGLALGLTITLAPPAIAQGGPRKVVIAHGSQQVEITHPGLYLGGVLGFAQEEVSSLSADHAGIAAGAPAARRRAGRLRPGDNRNGDQRQGSGRQRAHRLFGGEPLQFADRGAGGRPIREVKDLKGKQVGVFSLASGGVPYLKARAEGGRARPGEGRHDGADGRRRAGAAGAELRDGRRAEPVGRGLRRRSRTRGRS